MAQFKVGDRVRRKCGGKIWDNGPETAIVKGIHDGNVFSVVDHPYNGKSSYDDTKAWVFGVDDFTLDTPPATIQHEGYNNTRGEPVVPDWVNDGAWVVHKESGKIGKVSKAYMGSAYFKPLDKKFRVNFSNHLVAEDFRPFTNEDWKWGMWAEYKGEKVFVNNRIHNGVMVSKPSNPYFFIPFSELTPTTAP